MCMFRTPLREHEGSSRQCDICDYFICKIMAWSGQKMEYKLSLQLLVFVLFILSCYCLTPDEFPKCKANNKDKLESLQNDHNDTVIIENQIPQSGTPVYFELTSTKVSGSSSYLGE